MPFERIEGATRAHLLSQVADRATRWHARGCSVDVVVPGTAWEEPVKLMLSPAVPCGVRVCSWDHWLEGLWGVWGDGRTLVTPHEARMLLRPLLAQLLGYEPSVGYVEQLHALAAEALALVEGGADAHAPLDEHERRVVALLREYAARLGRLGLVEP